MTTPRTPYPTDVSDEEWAFVAPYLTLLPEEAGQRTYSLREVFNALRWIARAGASWRMMPNDLRSWYIVCQFGCFMAGFLGALWRSRWTELEDIHARTSSLTGNVPYLLE